MSNNGIVELYRIMLTDDSNTWETADLSDALPKKQIERLAEHTVNNLLGDQAVSNLRDLKTFIADIQNDDYELSTFFENRLSTHDVNQHSQWTALSIDLYNNETNLNSAYQLADNTISANHDNLLTFEVTVSNKLNTFSTDEATDINNMSDALLAAMQTQQGIDENLSTEYSTIINNIDASIVLKETQLDTYNTQFQSYSTDGGNLIDNENQRLTTVLGVDGTFKELINDDSDVTLAQESTFDFHMNVRQAQFSDDYKLLSEEAHRVNTYADNGDTLMNDTLTTYSDKFNELHDLYETELNTVSDTTRDTMSDITFTHDQFSQEVLIGLDNISADVAALDAGYTAKVGELSDSVYNTQQQLISLENRKAQKDNPVFTGTLVLDNKVGDKRAELHIGDNWSIRSVKSTSAGVDAINLELAYLPSGGSEKVIKFASQVPTSTTVDYSATKHMRVTTGTAAAADYYYVFPDGTVDNTDVNRVASVLSVDGSVVEIEWGTVVPRACELALTSNTSTRITVKPVQDA